MKIVSKVAGLAAITHISLFPLLDTHFRQRVQDDIVFALQAYQMGYYSGIICGPDTADRPHSPYHQSVACHAFTFGSRRRTCCNTDVDNGLNSDGTPVDGSGLATRLQAAGLMLPRNR